MQEVAVHPTVTRLRDAINRHDLDAAAASFAADYRSEQPAHPNRGFGGRGQVATNWRALFAGVPDLQVEVLAEVTDGSTSWSEWVWRGSHLDGTEFCMRGVTIFDLRDDGLISAGRLYMEPVERGGIGIDAAVRALARPSG